MVLSGDPSVGAEAERIVIPVIADPRITPVYRGHAFTALAGALLAQGRSQEAEAKAREALTLIAAAPVYRPRVLALLMMSLRAQSRAAEAVPLAQEGLRLLGTFGGAGRTELMFRHAVVLTWIDMGNLAVAREALGVALQQLQVRAARIPGTEMRQTFLSGVPTNVRLRELAQQYLPKPEKR
jgi:tetratricopeptide (TPR) repeat protein